MLSRSLVYGINVNFSSISRKKELFWRSAKVDVSLSELNALSERHPLSETSTRLTDRRNLEGNMSCRHALSASSARSASRLSPPRVSASLALSESSRTRAKRAKGAKCDIEVSGSFLSLNSKREKGGWREHWIAVRAWRAKNKGKEHSKEAKFWSFRKIYEFLSDCEIPRGGGDIPTPL